MGSLGEQEAAEALRQRGWIKAFTVSEMVGKWDWFVDAVEGGYGDDVDEYINDLYRRNWLHEAWVLLDADVIEDWTRRIHGLDDRFRAATVFDDGLSLSRHYKIERFDPDSMWWWRRRPCLLVGDLARELPQPGAGDDLSTAAEYSNGVDE